MTINKFQGRTEEEAKAKAREELGAACVIMNVKEIKPKGLLGIFSHSTYEVTAAIEDDVLPKARANTVASVAPTAGGAAPAPGASKLNLVVDDDLDIKKISNENSTVASMNSIASPLHEATLKDAFKAVNDVIEKQNAKSSQSEEEPTAGNNNFEPLADTARKVHIVNETNATYQRPDAARPKVEYVKPTTIETVKEVEPESVGPKPKQIVEASPMNTSASSIQGENHTFVKTLYNVLLENEVQEKYINQVLEDMDRVLTTSRSLDSLLSSVYQKMVLKIGQPNTISIGGKRPKIVFFIGPTGVGKTTTIAKIASKFKVEEGKRVGLITADTYRMAAADQLRTYANILNIPMTVIYSGDELNDAIKKQVRESEELDLILVDTIGFSHKNEEQKKDMKALLEALDESYDKEVFLVLSATTKYKDLVDISKSYLDYTKFSLIFTKLDETTSYGNIFNLKLFTAAPLSYFTFGQNVPDDIEVVNAQRLVKQLLGGN